MANLFSLPRAKFWDDIETNDFLFKWTLFLIVFAYVLAHAIYTNIPGEQSTAGIFLFFAILSIVFAAVEHLQKNSRVFNFYGLGNNPVRALFALGIGSGMAFLILGGLKSVLPIPFAVVGPTLSLTWLWVVIFSPILETIFFRGTIFPTLKLWFSGTPFIAPYLAMIITSGLFAVYHYAAYGASISSMEGAFVFSTMMILGNQALKSIGFEFGFHFINNYLAFGG